MDSALLKTLLAAQDQAYKSALEVFMGQVSGKIEALQSAISDLTRSLEFTQSEMEDLKSEVKQLKREKEENQATIKALTEDSEISTKLVKDLEDRCNYQEDYNRRNNLQITGLDELPGGETWEQTAKQVSKLLEDKLQLPNIQIERAHRTGPQSSLRHRPVIARFQHYCDREAVLRNAAKLRGTRVFINEDLCPASQEKRKAQLPLLKRARSEGKLAYFRYTKLIVRDKQGASEKAASDLGAAARHAPADVEDAVASAGPVAAGVGDDGAIAAGAEAGAVGGGFTPAAGTTPVVVCDDGTDGTATGEAAAVLPAGGGGPGRPAAAAIRSRPPLATPHQVNTRGSSGRKIKK